MADFDGKKINTSKLPEDMRLKMPAKEFGDPINRTYPIISPKDVEDALRLVGKDSHPDWVRGNILKICRKNGWIVPDSLAEWAKQNGK